MNIVCDYYTFMMPALSKFTRVFMNLIPLHELHGEMLHGEIPPFANGSNGLRNCKHWPCGYPTIPFLYSFHHSDSQVFTSIFSNSTVEAER